MKSALVLAALATAATVGACKQRAQADISPSWLAGLIERQPGTTVEESLYQGRRAYHVMPGDRAADSGNEHVLYSNDGKVICEFGGFVGEVTVGSCDIEAIKYVRTIFPQSSP